MKAALLSYGESSEMRLRKRTKEISQAAKHNEWQQAIVLLLEMQGQELEPNIITIPFYLL